MKNTEIVATLKKVAANRAEVLKYGQMLINNMEITSINNPLYVKKENVIGFLNVLFSAGIIESADIKDSRREDLITVAKEAFKDFELLGNHRFGNVLERNNETLDNDGLWFVKVRLFLLVNKVTIPEVQTHAWEDVADNYTDRIEICDDVITVTLWDCYEPEKKEIKKYSKEWKLLDDKNENKKEETEMKEMIQDKQVEEMNQDVIEDELKQDEDNMDEILNKIVRMASNNHVRNQISRHMILSAITETVYGKRLVEYIDKQRVENYSADSMEYQYAEKFVEHLLNNDCIAPFVDMRGAVSTKSFRINAKAMVSHTAKAVLTYYRDVHRTVVVDGVSKKKTEREFLNVDTDKKEFTVRGKKFNMTDDNCKLIDELYRIR